MLSFFRSSPSGKRIPYASVLTDGILSSAFFQFIMAMWAVVQSILVRLGLIDSVIVFVDPVGSGLDDSQAIQSLADSLIGSGKTIVFRPGTYFILTEMHPHFGWPNFRANSACRFIAKQVKIASHPTPACFYFLPAFGAATTLAADAAKGSMVVTVVSAVGFVPGSMFEIGGSAASVGGNYRVKGTPTVNGANFDVKIDRPLLTDQPSGALTRIMTDHVEGWHFDGGGCSFSGVTCRYFSLSRSHRTIIENVVFDDADGIASDLLSYDNCGVANIARNLSYRMLAGSAPGTGGIILESNELSVIENVDIRFAAGSAVAAVAVDTCFSCSVEEALASAVTISCEQGPYCESNSVNGGRISYLKFGQSVPGLVNNIKSTHIDGVDFVGQQSLSFSSYVDFGNQTDDTIISNCRMHMPLLGANGFAFTAQPQRNLSIDNNVLTADRSVFSSVAQNQLVLGFVGGAAGTHDVTVKNSRFADCETVGFSSSISSLKMRFLDCIFDNTKTGNATTCLLRTYGASLKLSFERCTGSVAAGSYVAIDGATSNVVTVLDSDFGAANWLKVGGVTTGYKRGQTTLSTSGAGGTWTSVVF